MDDPVLVQIQDAGEKLIHCSFARWRPGWGYVGEGYGGG